MDRRLKNGAVGLLLLSLGGCGSISRDDSNDTINPIIPSKTLDVSKSLSIPLEVIAAGAVVYLIVDPLAPNWKIHEAQLSADTFQIAMNKKRFSIGGDGEAMQIFRRRAQQITSSRGYANYQILEYTEGIESKTLGAHRVSYGIIQINKVQARIER